MRKLYKLGDPLNSEERKRFGMTTFQEGMIAMRSEKDGLLVRAQMTGESRPPKKGEWYISGALPVAYRAPNDLSTDYLIATLSQVKKTTTISYSMV